MGVVPQRATSTPLSSALIAECFMSSLIPLQIATPFLHSIEITDKILWIKLHICHRSGSVTVMSTPATLVVSTLSICPTRMHRSCIGSLHWKRIRDTRVFELTDSTVSGIGFWRRKSFGSGEVVRMEPIRLYCFAPGIQEWAKHI